MGDKPKRKWGDRCDGRWVRETTGLATIIAHIMPNRADAEVYLADKIDCTEVMKYIEARNLEHPNYKTTIFHCFLTAVGRMMIERPRMNRFVHGRRIYQRDEISMSFMAKRRFKDDAEESFMTLIIKPEMTLDEISHKIYGDLTEVRKHEHSTGGMDSVVDAFAKIPRPLLMLIVRIVRWLDFWGKVPMALRDGDSNFTSVLFSNLGSIKGPAVYHHLNNYGTNSIMITLGTVHKEAVVMPDGSIEQRDILDFGATIDERIGDGFYFVRSLNLVKYIFAHPELLNKPLGEDSGYTYE